MELWLDTLDSAALERAHKSGLLHGITTNPSILSKTDRPLENILEELLSFQKGPVAVQLTASLASEMIQQAHTLYNFSSRLIIKVPATSEGYQAISTLTAEQIPTMATAIFTTLQGLFAAKAGAHYLAPYVRHIGEACHQVLSTLRSALTYYQLPAKILAAALDSTNDIEFCLRIPVDAVTLKAPLFHTCFQSPEPVIAFLSRFEKEWQSAPSTSLLPR